MTTGNQQEAACTELANLSPWRENDPMGVLARGVTGNHVPHLKDFFFSFELLLSG